MTTYNYAIRFGGRLDDQLFSRLCRENPDLRLERTSNGELVVMTPAGAESGRRSGEVFGQLYSWNNAARLGVAFDASAGFKLPDGSILSPDASWIPNDRWESLSRAEREGFAPLCPDLVVELRSTTDSLRDLRAKMREYRSQGARLGWLIDPRRKVVEVYRPGRETEVLTAPENLSGGEVLPGFVLDLKEIS